VISGDWALALYKYTTVSTTKSNTPVTTAIKVATTTTTPAPAPTITAPGSYQPTNPVPADNDAKYVWAHHIVGNTYPYTKDTWMADIRLASANGIDGFMLNIGTDSWQPARVADAYTAAANSGTGFKVSHALIREVFAKTCR
jgi:glucan endo-1,3-alpha-glucosidase